MSIKPKINRDLNSAKVHFGSKLEILSWIDGEWWQGQAQNMAIFTFKLNLTLKFKVNYPPKE